MFQGTTTIPKKILLIQQIKKHFLELPMLRKLCAKRQIKDLPVISNPKEGKDTRLLRPLSMRISTIHLRYRSWINVIHMNNAMFLNLRILLNCIRSPSMDRTGHRLVIYSEQNMRFLLPLALVPPRSLVGILWYFWYLWYFSWYFWH